MSYCFPPLDVAVSHRLKTQAVEHLVEMFLIGLNLAQWSVLYV